MTIKPGKRGQRVGQVICHPPDVSLLMMGWGKENKDGDKGDKGDDGGGIPLLG
jgi:hypothetical protein